MTSLRKTQSGNFIICFRYEGRQFQRSLQTKDRKAAEASLNKVAYALYQIANGGLSVPESVDPGAFIVNGRTKNPAKDNNPPPKFAELIEPYLRELAGQKAESTLHTERTHLKNLVTSLGSRANGPINCMTKGDLEAALRKRRETVLATTVMKERQTLVSFLNWIAGKNFSQPKVFPAENLCTFQEDREKKRFRTRGEIEQILARGGLSGPEIEAHWECLYLTVHQIGDVLELCQNQARYDFIFPMVSLTAYTGMRRGEILRLRWSDVNFDAGLITARSRKQSRQNVETSRDIPIHSRLREVLAEYQLRRPEGQFVICQPCASTPLTVNMAHGHLQRTLTGTRWEQVMPNGKKKTVIGFHTFRHSFASNLAVQGVDQRLIDSMMGHQTEEMRKRYQHLFPQHQRSAIESLRFQGEKLAGVFD